ncbi:helix-turn-helix domain-containing protein [Cohnella silvisoli]|uniref:Helix-turn-helix domain-containing protein n=1 Tax=Cohnella silvisoli TaxID=2873699 RepID=A0ABV1KRP1_9BACL|nr:helix-turn-helix domain-containing protein [Cohnella silvisoli]MCD9022469.1 helix-turn-helix domain-containing protein [Cohnella silvisoli]
MGKSWFNRLLLSYLPVFFIIFLSLLLMTYLTISELSRKSAEKANEALSHNIMKLVDKTLDEIDSMMLYEIQNNERIKLFYSEKAPNERNYADLQAASELKELLLKNPMIDSIYLYRTSDQTVLTSSALTTLDAFADKQYLGLTVSSKQPYDWTFRSQRVSGQEEPIISLAKIADLFDYSIMVVNIRPESLRKVMQSMVYTKTTFVELTDRNDRFIVSTETDRKPDVTHPSKYTQAKVLSEAVSDLTGWTFRSGNHGGTIVEFVSSLFYIWMGLGFVIVVAGVLWLIYVSRRNYKPIRSLMNRLSNVRPMPVEENATGKVDEFQLIETTIEGLLDESNMLQEQHQKNMVYRKRHLFLSMMEGNAGSQPNVWLEELKQLGMDAKVTATVVALAEIDDYAEFERQYRNDQHLLKHVLSKVVQEMSENKRYTVWTEWIDHCRLAILAIFRHQEDGEQEMVLFCEALRQWVEENLDFTVTIGVGRQTDGLERISESFRDAIAAVGFKPSLGYNRIIELVHVLSRPKGELFKQLQCIRALSQSFRAGDKEWERHYQEMYDNIQDQLYSYDDLYNLMQVLIGHLQKEMAELPEEMYRIWNEDTHGALLNALKRNEKLDDKFNEFRSILQEAQIRIGELRESKSTHQLVFQVKDYISDNSHNPNLSLMQLSEEFRLNASYLSRLFKEAFGVKFVEYVTSIRMEKAERLLVDTEDAIQDIGRAVGYEQSMTFIRVFKKHTGITPGQYRKMKM